MENKSEQNATETVGIFPKGELGPAANFTGNAWNTLMVANDSTYNTVIGNVYFEPGARSNWHLHPAGQILIITGGVGVSPDKRTTKTNDSKRRCCEVYCIGMVQTQIPACNSCTFA